MDWKRRVLAIAGPVLAIKNIRAVTTDPKNSILFLMTYSSIKVEGLSKQNTAGLSPPCKSMVLRFMVYSVYKAGSERLKEQATGFVVTIFQSGRNRSRSQYPGYRAWK
jgi:hypothetical protein